jgi:hypothetical protein
MGNVSTSSVDVINQSIINVILSTAQQCQSGLDSTQTITRSGSSLFSSASQNVNFSLTCLQDVKIDNSLLSSIANAVQQSAQQNGVALLPSFSGSNASANIKNYLETKITNSVIQNCVASLKNQQSISYSGTQIGVVDSQNVSLVMECLSKSLNNVGVSQGLINSTSSTVKQTNTNPLDFITNLLSSPMYIIGAIIGLIIVMMYMGSSSGAAPQLMLLPQPTEESTTEVTKYPETSILSSYVPTPPTQYQHTYMTPTFEIPMPTYPAPAAPTSTVIENPYAEAESVIPSIYPTAVVREELERLEAESSIPPPPPLPTRRVSVTEETTRPLSAILESTEEAT